MKLTITIENSNDLAAIINAMVIILLMEVDESYAEQVSSELLDQTIFNASCDHKNEIMCDTNFKVADPFRQDPFTKRVTLSQKILHVYHKSCDSIVEMRKKENSNPRKLNGTNQVDQIINVDNDILSNIYSKKEVNSSLSLQEKTNELGGKIRITSNNRTKKMPATVGDCNRLKKKTSLKLFTTDYKKVEIMPHFKPINSQSMPKRIDKILKIGNEHTNVIRKLRQIDVAETTLSFINDKLYTTCYHTTEINILKSDKNNNIIIPQDDIANENSELVKHASNYNDTMEGINNKSPKFDINEANFITSDEKMPISYYYKSTRSAQTNKSANLPKFNDKALKRSKATKNYIVKKYNNKGSGRKPKTTKNNKFWLPDNNEKNVRNSTENYEEMQKNSNINKTQSNIENNNVMLKIINKIQNYYKSYETKSMVLGKSYGIRHKLPYARTLQYKGRDLFPFYRFFTSPCFSEKNEITNRLKNIQNHIDYKFKFKTNRLNDDRITRASSDLYYIKLAKKVFATANNQYHTTTPIIVRQNEPDKPIDIFDEAEADDDDDLVSSAATIKGMYNSNNDCSNNNDNRYNYYTHAITNENNVNNVILINMRTKSPSTTTTTTTTIKYIVYPAVQVIKEEFPMDHNLLIAIIFTSFVILVCTTCCCAPIVLIKKQKECLDTQGMSATTSSSSDSEDSSISYHCN